VAQPEDNIKSAGLFPRIGVYDDWAIEWGYKWMPQYKTAQDEVSMSNKWIMEKLASDKRLTFGTESDGNDPRNQSEDLGDNAMIANAYGIKNLQRILPNLLDWTKEADKDYTNTREMYSEVVTQFTRYAVHVSRNIAGIYTTPKKVEQSGAVYEYVPAATQKEAMAFLTQYLFATPTWLINKDLIQKVGVDPVSMIGYPQKGVLGRLISKYTFDKMLQNEAYNGSQAYTPFQMLEDLKKSIWSELAVGKPIDIYRRNLQKAYVDALAGMVSSTTSTGVVRSTSDASGIARIHLLSLKADIAKALVASTGVTKAHLLDLVAQISEVLDNKK